MDDDQDTIEKKVNTQRIKRLAIAEWFDAWRIVPRLLVTLYVFMVIYLIDKFFSMPTYQKIECNADLVVKLVQANIPLQQAQEVACRVVDVVGGPTTTHTVLVTAVCGLATAIFGLYTNSGRDWAKGALPWRFRKNVKEKVEEKDDA